MRWSPRSRKPSADIIGYIDHFDETLIRGWTWDASAPADRLRLDVFVGGIYAGRARTGYFREDLKRNNVGDGRHAFVFHIPTLLRGSGTASGDIEVLSPRTPPRRLGKIIGGVMTSDVGPWEGELTPASYFRPLVSRLNATPRTPLSSEVGVRRQMDQMLASNEPGEPCQFVTHIAHKYGMSKPTLDDEGFWEWYLGVYGRERGPARVPLSAYDLDALRALRRASEPALKAKAGIYRWAVDEARSLFVEDCLVTDSERTHLRHVPIWHRATPFPLSRFMRRFISSCTIAESYDAGTIDDRIKLYALVMLFALWDAHYLTYLPAGWLTKMLERGDRESPFEHAQEELLGLAMTPDLYRQHIGSLEFDLDEQTFRGTAYRRGRVSFGDRILPNTEPVDVQLIGPFRRSLGLAESCRRLAVGLQATGFTLNFFDFDIGRASAGAETSFPINEVRSARVNILHVNAEEVPEAIAYLPDGFSQSHTILVPYWELNRPARQHTLGTAIVDEIWATTTYLAEVFANAKKPITWIGMSADDRTPPTRAEGRALMERLGLPSKPFVFLTTSDALSWPQRKNPLGVIHAFQAAFPSVDAALVIKTRHASASVRGSRKAYWQTIRARCEEDPRVFLVDQDLSDRDQRALLAGCDCLVSLHRAEGLGLDMLDALANGTPVIATAYSGNMDYCDARTAWLVDFDLVAVAADDYAFVEPGHVWAEPRLGSAVAALQSLVRDQEERNARTSLASLRIKEERSLASFSSRLAEEIGTRLDANRSLLRVQPRILQPGAGPTTRP